MDKKNFVLLLTCTVFAAFLGELVASSIYYLSRNPNLMKETPFFAYFDNSYNAKKIIENQLNFLDTTR